MENERSIEITLENGKKAQGEILFTFEANGDNFVLYEMNDKLFGAKTDQEGVLTPIEEDEWELVEKVYKDYIEDNGGKE